MRILIIDDDPQFLNMLQWMVENANHEVVTAKNGDEGIKLFSQDEFQIVITDILMPDKDGVETIHFLRSQSPKTPIIAISGGYPSSSGPSVGLTVAKRLGAFRILGKPFEQKELLEAVSAAEKEIAGESS
jgi:DNA-binding response OmpR family regulator